MQSQTIKMFHESFKERSSELALSIHKTSFSNLLSLLLCERGDVYFSQNFFLSQADPREDWIILIFDLYI